MDVWRAETWVGVKKHARVRARGCNAPDKYSGDESAQDGRFARTPGRTKRALDAWPTFTPSTRRANDDEGEIRQSSTLC